MINEKLIDKLSDEMKKILEDELAAGNKIVDTTQGRFSNSIEDAIFIVLKFPFKAKIKSNIEGIKYLDVNDRHYWKAEYYDERNHQSIICNFD